MGLSTRTSTTKKRGTHARQMPYYRLIAQLIWFVESECLACYCGLTRPQGALYSEY